MSKGVHVSSGCARYRSVYAYIIVKGSRICEHCNVLAVRKYVRASMVQGYSHMQVYDPGVTVRRPVPVPFPVL